jgi:hypothetical protein
MKDKERGKLYLDRLLKHQEHTKEYKIYSIKRIDLLIVSISSAGIYVVFETFKFFAKESTLNPNLSAIKVSGVLFVFSIVLNFISQFTANSANEYEVDSTEMEIQKAKGDKVDECKLKKIDRLVKRYNRWTGRLNTTSTSLMIGGLGILTVFYLLIF